MKKIVPLVTCEITFGQNLCELMFGVKCIESCQTTSPKQLYGFLTLVSLWDFCLLLSFFITASCPQRFSTQHWNQDVFRLRECDQFWSVRDSCAWFESVSACLVDDLPTGLRGSLSSLVLLVWFGEEGNTSITKSQRSSAGIPSIRNLH